MFVNRWVIQLRYWEPGKAASKTQASANNFWDSFAFWDGHRVYLTDFDERGLAVNLSQHIQTLKHLKRGGVVVFEAAFNQQSCNVTTLVHTPRVQQNLQFEPIIHSPYSPVLAPCDFYFFLYSIESSDDEAKAAGFEKSEKNSVTERKGTCLTLGEMCEP